MHRRSWTCGRISRAPVSVEPASLARANKRVKQGRASCELQGNPLTMPREMQIALCGQDATATSGRPRPRSNKKLKTPCSTNTHLSLPLLLLDHCLVWSSRSIWLVGRKRILHGAEARDRDAFRRGCFAVDHDEMECVHCPCNSSDLATEFEIALSLNFASHAARQDTQRCPDVNSEYS